MGAPAFWLLVSGLAGLGHCSRLAATSRVTGELKTSAGSAGNPLVARYRELARHYRDDARDAEAAAQVWAAKARAAVYGGGGMTQTSTYNEVERQGVPGLARSVRAMDRMLKDPRPQRAAEAARKAAEPYKESYEEYKETGDSYAATANGYIVRAKNDEALVKQLSAYAEQQRMEAGDAAADPFARQSQRLAKEAQEFRNVAAEYSTKAKKVKDALPSIKRMAESASAYAAWTENPAGAVAADQLYTYTVAPPIDETESAGGK